MFPQPATQSPALILVPLTTMRTFLFLAFIAAFILQAGCGGGGSARPDDMPKIYPVKITVTQDSAALQGATVTLTAKTPAKYGVASGLTDAYGVASIRTYGYIGVPEGQYTVTVSKQEVEDAKEATDADGNSYQTGGKVYEYVNVQYSKTDTSPLNVEVTTKGATASFEVDAPVHVFISDN